MYLYSKKQSALRSEAVEWQNKLYSDDYYKTYDPDEVYSKTLYFRRMGKRYGLLEEFRENGII